MILVFFCLFSNEKVSDLNNQVKQLKQAEQHYQQEHQVLLGKVSPATFEELSIYLHIYPTKNKLFWFRSNKAKGRMKQSSN